jgi:hypothetical protein
VYAKAPYPESPLNSNFEIYKMFTFMSINKRQINPITGLDRPWGFLEVEDSRFFKTISK